MADIDNVMKEFLVESHEGLDMLDRELVQIEANPKDRASLDLIFRTVHTIKGTCGFFGLPRLERLTHAGENVLSAIRDGLMPWSGEVTSAMLALVDAIRGMLASVESTGTDGEDDCLDLIERFEAFLAAGEGEPDAATRPITLGLAPSAMHEVPPALPEAATADPVEPEEIPSTAELPGEVPRELATAGSGVSSSREGVAGGNIRVNVSLLDRLMNLVGELVLARNQILQHSTNRKDASFLGTSQRLNLITTELQEGVMKTRMQPIGTIWDKFPRLVRDLAVICRKQVRIEMEGRGTELDKTIIEAIKDPLTHIVRNSLDHGIEPAEERARKGKPATATLRLRAYHESGQVNIEISDDGGGIDPQRIARKAVERGLITPDAAARLNTHDLIQLIFLPGFSTAEKVTNISGRGVGMDVVKTNIEKIAGSVDIDSRLGKGTTVRIKIPLTLAIIPALIVESAGQRFAIPQVNLLELVRLEGEQVAKSVEWIHGAPVYRLRGRLLPLVYLNRLFGLEAEGPSADRDGMNVIVLQADDRQFGLVVEGIADTEEIVVKPLAKQLKSIEIFAGATIMGDGRVSLILDVAGIAKQSRLQARQRDRHAFEQVEKATGVDESNFLLLVQVGERQRLAVPLGLVDRLEEIPGDELESSLGEDVVQYRGQIMPLLPLGSALRLGPAAPKSAGHLQVVVYSEEGRSVGLVVSRILDIVRSPVEVQRSAATVGILGSAVIQGQVTDLVDLPALIHTKFPEFSSGPALAKGA